MTAPLGVLLAVLVFLGIWIPAAVAAGVTYTAFLSQGLGRTGIETVGAIIIVPVAVLVFAVLVWVPLRLVMRRSGHGFGLTLALAGLVAAALALIFCGPSCFLLRGTGPLLGPFMLLVCLGAAALHEWLHRRIASDKL